MYAFYSEDFGKTAYVSDVSNTYSGDSNRMYVPLETMYVFDDLSERFRADILAAINSETYWTSAHLKVARFGKLLNGVVTTYDDYLTVWIAVSPSDGYIYLHYYIFSDDTYRISISDWLAQATPLAQNFGKIYLANFKYRDGTSYPAVFTRSMAYYMFNVTEEYIGTYISPSSTYPNGGMRYSGNGVRVPCNAIPIAGLDQLGVSGNTEAIRNQTELMGYAGEEFYISSGSSMFLAYDGSYDPDPPPPPWDPDDGDPTKDDHDEPGDDPPVRPGDKERPYDPIPIPGLPSVSGVGAGFVTLYRPSQAMLQLFASQMYDNNIIQQLVNYFGGVQEIVAGLAIVPFQPPISGRAKHRIGLVTINVEMDKISDQFVSINCGDIEIKPYYNNFLDYTPYTKLIIWLPYIGYQEISADEVMGQTINVTYHCDCLSGACVAFISTGVVGATGPQIPRVLGQFSGNLATQVPTASASYDSMISNAINILTTAVGVAGSAAVSAANVAAMEVDEASAEAIQATKTSGVAHRANDIASSGASLITSMKPNVNRNGTPGSSAGYMSVQKPYLIRFTPRQSLPDNYITQRGYPSNKGGTLSSFSGYCEVEDIQLNDVPATISEINEIYRILKGGVLL